MISHLGCPQCGENTAEFFEGYCESCCQENQKSLDMHNAEYDFWEGLSDQQRNKAIRSNVT